MSSTKRSVLLALFVALALIVGLALRADALRIGYTFDDYGHLAARHHAFPVQRAAWNLYAYVFDRPAEHAALRAAGNLPWWSDPHVQFAMLRPLASLLIAFDDRVAPLDARFAHWHSAIWWCVALAALAYALSRRARLSLVGVALGLYALAESHTLALAWIANRTALVSLTFALVALALQQDAQSTPRARTHALAALAWCLAFAGGEYALGLVAYAAAFEVRAPRPGRNARIASFVIPATLYLLAHRLGGYGTRGSGAYIDPLRETSRFVQAFPQRFGALLAHVFGGAPIDRVLLAFTRGAPLLAVGVVVSVVVIALAWRCTASWRDDDERRVVRAWIAAAPFALLPMTGGFPSPRLALVATPGVAVAIAVIVVGAIEAWRSARRIGWRLTTSLAAMVLLSLHALLVPLRIRHDLAETRTLGGAGTRTILASPVRHDMRPDTHALVLAAADPSTLFYAPTMWHLMSRGAIPMPRAWWVVSMVLGAQVITRPAPDVLEFRALQSDMLIGPFEQLFRDAAERMRVGDVFVAGDLTVEILTMGEHGPRAVRMRYARGWDSPEVVPVLSTSRGLVRVPLPRVGAGFPVPAAMVPLAGGE